MKKLLTAMLCVFCAVMSIDAQSFTGRMLGTVTDPSGAAIAGATVRIVNIGTNAEWTTSTDEEGRFASPELPRGEYSLEASSPGFKRFTRSGLSLQIQQQARVDVRLEVGDTAETIEVIADATLLETSDATLGKVVDNKRIMELPLNTRNVFSLIQLTPGVAGSISQDYGTGYSVNGVRASLLEVMVDGISTAHPTVQGYSGNSNFPPVDAIAEFKVQASNYSAEFGRSLGSVTNVVYKSGTNQFHGSVFEFLRNSKLDANNFFDNRLGRDLGTFQRSQFGGHVTGPIVKDKTFFLGSYEGLRQRSQQRLTATVPTDLQRQGDFSQTFTSNGQLIQVYNPFTTRQNPTGSGFIRDPFPGNVIPASMIDPVAQNVLNYYPRPNTPGDPVTQTNNYQQSGSGGFDVDQFDTRIDHHLTDTRRLFGRYSWRRPMDSPAVLFPDAIAIAEGRVNPTTRQHTAVLDYSETLSPTTILSSRLGFSRSLFIYDNQGLGFVPSSLGLNPAVDNTVDRMMFPRFDVGGFQNLGGNDHRYNAFMNYSALTYVTKIIGAHTLKAGYDGRLIRVNVWEARAAGTFNFTQGMTQGPNPNVASANAGSGLASLLLGTGTSGSLLQNWKNVASQSFYHAGYLQDDWRVTNRLTLNLGLRYEIETPRTERYDRMNYFDPSAPSPLGAAAGIPDLRGGLQFVNVGGNPRTQYNWDRNNWSPRIGFAYQATGKTVVRGGFGQFFGPSPQTAHGTVGPFGFRMEHLWLATLDNITPNQTLRNAFNEGFAPVPGSSAGLSTGAGGPIQAPMQDTVTPRTMQWNLAVQRELPGDILAEFAYVGNRGLNLMRTAEGQMTLNQLDPSHMALGSALNQLVDNPFYGSVTSGVLSAPRISRAQLLRPYPQFTDIIPLYWGGSSSNYNALQVTGKKRFSRGFLFEGSYTWSKTIEDAMSEYQNSYDIRSSARGLAPVHIPHRFVASVLYELPFGAGRPFLNNMGGVANALLGGWQINAISTYQAGTPLIIAANNTSGLFARRTLPNNNGQSGAKSGPVQERLNAYFDTTVFSQPAPFTFGNHSLYSPDIRGDSTRNWDISLFKQFRIGERVNTQFRAEAFNATNTVRFGNPNTSVTSPQFGVIASQANAPRQIQLGLKFLF